MKPKKADFITWKMFNRMQCESVVYVFSFIYLLSFIFILTFHSLFVRFVFVCFTFLYCVTMTTDVTIEANCKVTSC